MATAPVALKPATKISEAKEQMVQAGAPKLITPPRKKSFTLDQDEVDYVKIMIFGPIGSGKTYAFGQLALAGYKVAIITTDIGDTGHVTIKAQLKKTGKPELGKNVMVIPLEGYDEVSKFLRNPYVYVPELEEFDPDFLGWDGFSGFQQIDLSEYVGDMQGANKDKERGDFRDSGLVLESQDWGAIRNATIRKGNEFLSAKKPNGKPLHKILTCHETVISKYIDPTKPLAGTNYVESYKPMLQGAGGQLLMGGFDLIIRTKVVTKKGDDGERREYYYVTSGSQNLVAKNRGFILKPEEPADMAYLFEIIKKGMGKDE